MVDRQSEHALRACKPVPILALAVALAMAAAQASTAPMAQAAPIDPAYDFLQSGAYAVGPVLNAATQNRHAIPAKGAVVLVEIDDRLTGMTVRRHASTRSGMVRLSGLDSDASVLASIVVDFSVDAPIALSPQVAEKLGLLNQTGLRKVLIEHADPR